MVADVIAAHLVVHLLEVRGILQVQGQILIQVIQAVREVVVTEAIQMVPEALVLDRHTAVGLVVLEAVLIADRQEVAEATPAAHVVAEGLEVADPEVVDSAWSTSILSPRSRRCFWLL